MTAKATAMNGNYRGGNSRLLAKVLDACPWPICWLQSDGEIVYANAAMCELAGADATELVGSKCSWQLAADGIKHGPLLGAIAPPGAVTHGEMLVRQIPWPPASPTGQIEQHFVPLAQNGTAAFSCLVIHAVVPMLKLNASSSAVRDATLQAAEWLMRLRSQWAQLDGLLSLYGKSAASQIAMRRAQLALDSTESIFATGPAGVGKTDVLRAVFAGRLKRAGRTLAEGRYFPIDCASQDVSLIEGMLDIFQSFLLSQEPAFAHQLVLERIDLACDSAVNALNRWLADCASPCCLSATSRSSLSTLSTRSEDWSKLVSHLGTIEIEIPSLASRREDISLLVQQALAVACHRLQRPTLVVSAAAMDLLTAYDWPENVAELQRFAIDVAGQVSAPSTLQPQHLPLAIRTFGSTVLHKQPRTEPIELDKVLLDLERTIIERALELSPRNRAQAARWLGISRPRLLRRIEELGLNTVDDADEGN